MYLVTIRSNAYDRKQGGNNCVKEGMVQMRTQKRKKKTTPGTLRSLDRRSTLIGLGIGILLVLMIVLAWNYFMAGNRYYRVDVDASEPDIDVQLLDINQYSRPGDMSDPITGVVIHYTANPGSTAQENRDYFNSLQDGHEGYVSSHFVIGLEGEIIQCIPTWEIAYASNERNHDTVSIECCHPDETGVFNEKTYESMVHLTAFLCEKYNLDENDVIRHYDVTGKNCPKYFVEDETAWEKFKDDVGRALAKGNGES